MSYNMILAFWEAMDATNWYVDLKTPLKSQNGPKWWDDFTLHRACQSLGVHVGAYEASRAFANKKQGAYCSWSTWCSAGLACNRAW